MKLVTISGALFLLATLTTWATLERASRAEAAYTKGTDLWKATTSHIGWPVM